MWWQPERQGEIWLCLVIILHSVDTEIQVKTSTKACVIPSLVALMRKDLFLYHLTSAEMFAKIWHKYFMLQKVFQQACFRIQCCCWRRYIKVRRFKGSRHSLLNPKCCFCTVMVNLKKKKYPRMPAFARQWSRLHVHGGAFSSRKLPLAVSHQQSF